MTKMRHLEGWQFLSHIDGECTQRMVLRQEVQRVQLEEEALHAIDAPTALFRIAQWHGLWQQRQSHDCGVISPMCFSAAAIPCLSRMDLRRIMLERARYPLDAKSPDNTLEAHQDMLCRQHWFKLRQPADGTMCDIRTSCKPCIPPYDAKSDQAWTLQA